MCEYMYKLLNYEPKQFSFGEKCDTSPGQLAGSSY